MALAQITLLSCASYSYAGKTYKKDQPATTSNPREIAWAETNGHFMVVDLEAEKKILEAEIAKATAAAKAAERANKSASKSRLSGSSRGPRTSDGGSKKTEESSDGGE